MDCNTSRVDVLQLALEPLWKLYEVCNQGTDVKAVLSKAVKSLGLTQVRPYSSCTGYTHFTRRQTKQIICISHFTHGLHQMYLALPYTSPFMSNTSLLHYKSVNHADHCNNQ